MFQFTRRGCRCGAFFPVHSTANPGSQHRRKHLGLERSQIRDGLLASCDATHLVRACDTRMHERMDGFQVYAAQSSCDSHASSSLESGRQRWQPRRLQTGLPAGSAEGVALAWLAFAAQNRWSRAKQYVCHVTSWASLSSARSARATGTRMDSGHIYLVRWTHRGYRMAQCGNRGRRERSDNRCYGKKHAIDRERARPSPRSALAPPPPWRRLMV